MATWTGLRRQGAGQGFTLLELLLTTALLLLLLGAVVFNFDSWQRGTQLDEAGMQVEGLLHFARAQAAQTGRRVQLRFEESATDELFPALGNVQLLWEPDPLEKPGVYQPLPEAEDYVRRITDTVMIESVRRLDANGRELPELTSSEGEGSGLSFSVPSAPAEPAASARTSPATGSADVMPPIAIQFYPDGTSDSAVIVITPWDYDDLRRMEVKVVGLTGVIRRSLRSTEPDAPVEEAEETTATRDVRVPASAAPAAEAPAASSATP